MKMLRAGVCPTEHLQGQSMERSAGAPGAVPRIWQHLPPLSSNIDWLNEPSCLAGPENAVSVHFPASSPQREDSATLEAVKQLLKVAL
jgi:hypothetical protein